MARGGYKPTGALTREFTVVYLQYNQLLTYINIFQNCTNSKASNLTYRLVGGLSEHNAHYFYHKTELTHKLSLKSSPTFKCWGPRPNSRQNMLLWRHLLLAELSMMAQHFIINDQNTQYLNIVESKVLTPFYIHTLLACWSMCAIQRFFIKRTPWKVHVHFSSESTSQCFLTTWDDGGVYILGLTVNTNLAASWSKWR